MGSSRRILRGGLALGAFLLCAGPACGLRQTSAAEAVNRLAQMLRAEETLAYEGIMEWSGSGRWMRTSRVLMTHFPGGPSLMTRERDRRGPRVLWRKRFHWLRDRDLLLANYLVQEEGREAVAGREGVVLRLRSAYSGRPSVRLVVDQETGLLLATEHFDYRGRRSFSSRFVTLLLDPELPPRPKAPSREAWRGRHDGRAGPPELTFRPLLPAELPEGFVRKWRWQYRSRSGEPRLRIAYGDGLSWIELTEERAEPGAEERVVRRRSCGSRTSMRVVVDGVRVWLEGKIEPGELVGLLESLSPEGER